MKKDELVRYFSGKTGNAIGKISNTFFEEIHEIRLRVNRPLTVAYGGKLSYITADGQLTYNDKNAVNVTEQEMQKCFEAVCQYSVHSFRREIAEGFVTVSGGHRVGLCGTPVIQSGEVENIKNISSLNFRIAHEIKGCADELYRNIFSDSLCNFLLAGVPSSGKTTLLRDLTRILGGRFKTSVIDERGEIAAVRNGLPQNDVGINTDVFDGYPKPVGISAAVRVMSPQIIVCDEIGSEEDFSAVQNASYSGVYVAASIHAASMEELLSKNININIFDKIAFLSDSKSVGKITCIKTRTVNGYA